MFSVNSSAASAPSAGTHAGVCVAEMNGKPLAMLLGTLQALGEEGEKLTAEECGGNVLYSRSGSANVVVWCR